MSDIVLGIFAVIGVVCTIAFCGIIIWLGWQAHTTPVDELNGPEHDAGIYPGGSNV